MSDSATDAFTATLTWLWALALAAGDAERAVKWQAATMRAFNQDFDEAAALASVEP